MANQPETPVYDAGVYQLEVDDPVQGGLGGVDNKPLLNLANRTSYLKQHVDNLENGTTIPPTVAPKNSPAFTGDPTAPTQPLGDNDISIATTAFVKGVAKGRLAKNVAGGVNITLSADEAAYAILDFSGALTANIAVIVPSTPYLWTVRNGTTGAYALTVKTAAGAGVTVTQGASVELWCDGTNVLLSTTDFVSPALRGIPTAPTADAGTNSTQVATTAFVQAALGGLPAQSVRVQFFLSNGTFTIPATVTKIRVRVWGGGGGGGGANNNGYSGGGAGGGYAEGVFTVTPGASYAVTVGAGGAGGAGTPNNGASGGTSSFGALISATGGIGGNNAYNGNGNPTTVGGSGVGGTINVTGAPGAQGSQYLFGGAGGTTFASMGTAFGGGGGTGRSGSFPGGGGGGTFAGAGQGYAGGNGGDGLVIVEY